MGKFHKDESGLAVVEATILLPFCMLMVLAVYFASIFMCQKANLQANLQTALIYYKNVESDTYVTADTQMDFTKTDGNIGAVGSSYSTPKELFPYRFFGMSFSESKFKNFFKSICGYMFFDTGSNVVIRSDSDNFVVYKTINATATQTVTPAINLAMVGVPSDIVLSVSGSVVVTDSDDLIRNVDFVMDILSDTKVGQMASDMLDKASGWYNKFKGLFNIS